MKLDTCHRERRVDGKLEPCPNLVPPGMTVCDECAEYLKLRLIDVPGILDALDDARGKRLRFSAARRGAAGPERTDEAPLPFNAAASRAERALRERLAEWCTWIAAARGHLPPNPADASAVARWLLFQVSWARTRHDGAEMVSRLIGVISAAARAVDRPADLTCLGECGHETDGGRCGALLFGPVDAVEVQCQACHAVHPAAALRAWLLARAEDQLMTASDVAGAVGGYGVEITPHRIHVWRNRGRLTPHGIDPATGHPTYRIGDVLDLLAGMRARQTRHRARTT